MACGGRCVFAALAKALRAKDEHFGSFSGFLFFGLSAFRELAQELASHDKADAE